MWVIRNDVFLSEFSMLVSQDLVMFIISTHELPFMFWKTFLTAHFCRYI